MLTFRHLACTARCVRIRQGRHGCREEDREVGGTAASCLDVTQRSVQVIMQLKPN